MCGRAILTQERSLVVSRALVRPVASDSQQRSFQTWTILDAMDACVSRTLPLRVSPVRIGIDNHAAKVVGGLLLDINRQLERPGSTEAVRIAQRQRLAATSWQVAVTHHIAEFHLRVSLPHQQEGEICANQPAHALSQPRDAAVCAGHVSRNPILVGANPLEFIQAPGLTLGTVLLDDHHL